MSDIQEEMKRIYKKAIEKDLERNYEQNLFVGRAIKLEEENKELQDRINKAVEYINKYKNQNWYIESRFTEELLNILQGSDKE